jgi:adenylate cyclase
LEIDFFSNGTQAAGDVRAVVADAAGASTARVLDAQGRMLRQIAADGGILQWKRDGNNFVTQLIDALNRVTTLQRDGSGYRMVASIGDAEVPATFEGVVAARLDRLPDGAKRVLQLCSVIGAQIPKRLLDRAADSATQLNGALGELERHDILERSALAGDPLYRIRHAVVQDVAYHGLPVARRKELHRSVAAAIEALEAERLPEHFAELAQHWQSAEQWAKALEYAQRAGDQAAWGRKD